MAHCAHGAEDSDKEEPSLELPSLGFLRRRSQPEPVEAAPEDEDAPEDWAPEKVTGPLAEPRTAPADHPAREADRDRFEPVGEGTPAPDHETTVVSEPVTRARDRARDGARGRTGGRDPGARGRRAPVERRGLALPAIGALPAAVVTGLLVGLVTVGLTWASLQLCRLVKDAPSCGNPGIFLLLVVSS